MRDEFEVRSFNHFGAISL